MSMTREEAIEVLENGGWWDSLIPVTTIEGRIEDDKLHEALDIAIAALRPVSREQVERVWRGYWIHEEIRSNQSTTGYFKISSCECSKCGCYIQQEANFCPYCGAAQTDEAVEMVMERLEKLKNEIG